MDFLGRALAGWYLSEQGYLVSFDASCRDKKIDDGPVYRFDIAAVKIKGGKVVQAAVGALRSWWSASAYLSPSRVRAHLLPGLLENLSDEAVRAFAECFDLGVLPVEKLLFFSHASPEKSKEAEDLLRGHGIETIYLERVAADLMQSPVSRLAGSDPLVTQVVSLLKGAVRETEATVVEEDTEEKSAPVVPPPDPQLPLDLFLPKSEKK